MPDHDAGRRTSVVIPHDSQRLILRSLRPPNEVGTGELTSRLAGITAARGPGKLLRIRFAAMPGASGATTLPPFLQPGRSAGDIATVQQQASRAGGMRASIP
jgi:hypothetical protein